MVATRLSQKLAPLPPFKVGGEARGLIFETAIMDAAGPFLIRNGKVRAKRWLLLFSCPTYRATHIEVLHSSGSDSIILALERFISRRSAVRNVYSDQGTNFKGADRTLRELLKGLDLELVKERFHQITWHFSPGAAPHMQGAVEAKVKAAKRALVSVAAPGQLGDEAFNTATVVIERILNDTPIATQPVSSDPRDPKVIRPSDFLGMGGWKRLAPTIDLQGKTFTKRWVLMNKILDSWWRHFQRMIIPELNRLPYWRRTRENLKTGDLVVVLDEKNDRGHWPLGKIEEIHTSESDGLVRWANVLVRGRKISRPILRLIPINGH